MGCFGNSTVIAGVIFGSILIVLYFLSLFVLLIMGIVKGFFTVKKSFLWISALAFLSLLNIAISTFAGANFEIEPNDACVYFNGDIFWPTFFILELIIAASLYRINRRNR